MTNFIILFIINIIISEFFLNFTTLIEQLIYINNIFIVFFIVFFIINFFLISKKEVFNVNLDILTKYYLYFFKSPNHLFNFIKNIFKQIYVYNIYFKYKFFLDTNYMILKKFLGKFNLIWKPLFKRFSYFGYFRSNRSKWIK